MKETYTIVAKKKTGETNEVKVVKKKRKKLEKATFVEVSQL
jgi:hypothetical protein